MSKRNIVETTIPDNVAIITGASSGIGEAIARLFAKGGAAVMIVHHDQPDQAQWIVDEIVEAGGKARLFAADVRDEADVEHVFEATRRELGMPTILVNSAGIALADMELAHFGM